MDVYVSWAKDEYGKWCIKSRVPLVEGQTYTLVRRRDARTRPIRAGKFIRQVGEWLYYELARNGKVVPPPEEPHQPPVPPPPPLPEPEPEPKDPDILIRDYRLLSYFKHYRCDACGTKAILESGVLNILLDEAGVVSVLCADCLNRS